MTSDSRVLIRDCYYNAVLFIIIGLVIWFYGPLTFPGLIGCAIGWIGPDIIRLALRKLTWLDRG